MVKTRFAPSPTGFLHIGGLRSALFAYLFAKKNKGKFVLRIEDTDRERFVDGGIENILNSLKWAGIEADEGVVCDGGGIKQKGGSGPYIQSERLGIYKKYIGILLDNGGAYYCFCAKGRLDNLRKKQELNKQATGYDGHCRNLNQSEIDAKIGAGKPYVVRLKVPKEGKTNFKDMVRGGIEFENKLIDDQILIKADGFPTYHFAVVVDDYLMGITNVIRGEEWLSSTPKHILLYKAFKWSIPEYAHLPLLVNEKKQKLSKRHGDVSVKDFRERGYLPEALINFVAFLGWNPGDEREIFSLPDLEKEFCLKRVGKAAAVFNINKLNWYNKQYMMKMDIDELTDRALPFFNNSSFIGQKKIKNEKGEIERLKKIVALELGRANTLVELVEASAFVFASNLEYKSDLLVWKKSTKKDTKDKLAKLAEFLETVPKDEWNQKKLEEKITAWIKENNFGTGDVLWPMRVALSGRKNSPGPFEIAEVLGKEKSRDRIKKANVKLR